MIVVIVFGSVETELWGKPISFSAALLEWKQLLDGSFSFDFTRCTVSAYRNPSSYVS